jgi:hypothetical protein
VASGFTINKFNKGRNTDIDGALLDPLFYTNAHNLELVGAGKFFSLKNIKGTLKVEDVINTSNTEILDVFENFYKIGSTSKIKCLTIFTATEGGNFKIWCYDLENDDLYELYEETIEDDYLSEDRIVDGRSYAENNIDILEFTDNYNELRQLRCEIVTPYVANALSDYDLSLLRRGAGGTIELDSVDTGGSLVSGTYQITYRMVDTDRKRYTKWSSLTNPIHVYSNPTELITTFTAYAGIGLLTNKKITFDIVPTDEELANFDKFQIAVVENIFPSGPETIISGENQTFVAALQPIKSISELTGYEYKANEKIGTVPIEDIVVDLAPIKTAKTLAINQKKLFAGNIKYHDLEFDNGDPIITGGSVELEGANYYDENESSLTKGYFRDEVYRFGIVYYDKYGNKSPVKVLNMSSVTGNQISGSLTDMKFPSRSLENDYSILSASNGAQILGLSLTGIQNHPTWAVGFEIVRVKRIKKILFQTPVIPMTTVEGIGAFLRYPSLINTTNDDADTKSYPDAQPMTSSKVYVPKNLFWPELRKITRRTTSVNGDGIFGTNTFNRRAKGESQLKRQSTYDYAILFSQDHLYGDSQLVLSGTEKLQTVDFCITRLNFKDFSNFDPTTNPGDHGNHINTKVAGTFYALRNGDYYFDSAWSGKSINDSDNQIIDHANINSLGEGVILSGEKVLQYNELSTDGVPFGYEPKNQKMSVVKLSSSFNDEGAIARTFANGTRNAYASNAFVTGTSGVRYEDDTDASGDYTNLFVNKYSSYTSSNYVQVIRIANVIRGEIGDDRYGDNQTQHEFISTGAKYAFTTLELADVAQGNSVPVSLDVWGGDCFVAPHTFKISDSTYSVVNQTKNNGAPDSNTNLRKYWDNILYSIPTDGVNPNPKICMPVALQGVAQHVQVFLESEYNGQVLDYDTLKRMSAVSTFNNILNIETEGSIRSPFTYKYNINLSKNNDQRVYFPRPEFALDQNEFSARIAISDDKVYNTDIQGFDVFKVLNFFDLEENGGALHKLALAGDNLYALQEKKTTYLPVGQTQIEATDAGALSVGTGSDIGRPIVIDTKRGTQHMRGVTETGSFVYIPDNENKAIYRLSGQQLEPISSLFNDTEFRTVFEEKIPEKNVLGLYDPVRKEYWFIDNLNNVCHVFNEALDTWVSNYEFEGLNGGVYTNQKLYLIGKVGEQISVYEMYTGDANQLFGQTVTPRVTMIVNPDEGISKTFDNQMFVASDRLATVDHVVEREQNIGNQIVSGTIVDLSSREGNFRITLPRDSNNERLRGLRLLTTIKWKTDTDPVSLNSVYTKYRHSSRTPF